MKKNPWLVVFSVFGVLIVLVLAAIAAAMYTAFGEKTPTVASNSVLVLDIKGVIVDSKPFIKSLEKYKDDKDIKAIVIRLDSPGGVVGPSQEIYDAILKSRQEGKHIVASFGSLAARAGEYNRQHWCDHGVCQFV
jgi:protease-4